MSELGGNHFFPRPRMSSKPCRDGQYYRAAKAFSKKLHRYFTSGVSRVRQIHQGADCSKEIRSFPSYLNLYWQLPESVQAEISPPDSIETLDAGELQRMSAEIMEEETIIDFLTCPQCHQYIRPPSVCCELGHFMCGSCKEETDACPICKVTSFPNKANAIFDGILKEIYYPCINQEAGCPGFFKYDEIEEHQNSCAYNKVPCRFASAGCPEICKLNTKEDHELHCSFGVACLSYTRANEKVKVACHWKGSVEQLFDHVCNFHDSGWLSASSLQTNVTFPWMLPMTMDFQKTELFRLADVNELFYFHVRNEPYAQQYLAVQHIGSSEVSSLYMYTVEFKYGSKQILFRDTVIPGDVKEIFSQPNCCSFHYKFLVHHFQAERVCDCYVRVYRKGHEDKRGKRILNFLGTHITEERDGRVSNRDSFHDRIEYCLESMDVIDVNGAIDEQSEA